MTANVFELLDVDQVFPTAPPRYITRAILGYSSRCGSRGTLVSVGSGNSNPAAFDFGTWGEGFGGVYMFGLTTQAIGALDTGGSGSIQPPSAYFHAHCLNNASAIVGQLQVVNAGCGNLTLAADDQTTLLGMISIGGKTLLAKVGAFQLTGSAGDQAITGVGFRPDLIILGGVEHNFWGAPGANSQPGGLMFGAAASPSQQTASVVSVQYLAGVSGSRLSRMSASNCLLSLRPALAQGSLSSMDADGFTLSISGTGNTNRFGYLALADPNGQFAVGTGTQGDASFTPGFEPEIVIFVSAGGSALDSSHAGSVFSMGSVDGQLNQYAGFAGGANAQLHARYWDANAMALSFSGTSAPVVSARATATALGSTSSLTWPVNDGSGIKFGWVAMRTSKGPGYLGCGGKPPQIYRRL